MWQYSYLFDSKSAWERTVSDPAYSYDMPFEEFMKIYAIYRNSPNQRSLNEMIHSPNISQETKPKNSENAQKTELLEQSDIDELIKLMQNMRSISHAI